MQPAPALQVDCHRARSTTCAEQRGRLAPVEGFALELHDGTAALAQEWRAFEATAVATVFQSHAWIDAWCRTAAAARGETPLIVAGRDDQGTLAFVFPLAIVSRMGTRLLAWLGQSHAGYGAGLYRADVMQRLTAPVLRSILASVAASSPGVTGCFLAKQPLDWMGHRNPFAAFGRLPSPLTVTAFDLQADFKSFYEASVSSKKRSELRRSLKQLEKVAPVEIAIAGTAQDRLEAFSAFQAQKSEQLISQGQDNPFGRMPLSAFYRDLLTGEAGNLFQIGYMRVGDDIVAVDMAIRFGNRMYGLNRSMKSGELRRHSPGRLVNNLVVERACALGGGVFDLGPGEAAYKEEWGGQSIELFTTSQAFGAAGLPASAAIAAGAHARALLKRQERLWRVVQDARRRLRGRRAAT